jgi:hypothetical protein
VSQCDGPPQLIPPGMGYVYALAADDIAGAQWIYGQTVPTPAPLWLLGAACLAWWGSRKNVDRISSL